MNRLAYIFWAFPLFLAGCGQPRQAYVYRSEFLTQETATAAPAGLVFDPPALAATSGFGDDTVYGVNLNRRSPLQATNGYYVVDEAAYLRVRSYDRHANRRAEDGYLNRTATQYRRVFKVR